MAELHPDRLDGAAPSHRLAGHRAVPHGMLAQLSHTSCLLSRPRRPQVIVRVVGEVA